ncbi:hypothetical protein VTO73DRAFT_1399 [Trametes versicolor]
MSGYGVTRVVELSPPHPLILFSICIIILECAGFSSRLPFLFGLHPGSAVVPHLPISPWPVSGVSPSCCSYGRHTISRPAPFHSRNPLDTRPHLPACIPSLLLPSLRVYVLNASPPPNHASSSRLDSPSMPPLPSRFPLPPPHPPRRRPHLYAFSRSS